jgi:hypothetical protein
VQPSETNNLPQRLLLSAVLISAAVAVLLCADKFIRFDYPNVFADLLLGFAVWGVAGMFIGAAILCPFKQMQWGVVIGLAIPATLALWALLYYLSHPAVG